MKVLIICPLFPPEPIIDAKTTFHIAEEMTHRGHKVTVITAFPNRPAGKIFPGFRRRLFSRTKSESGFLLIRCFSTFSPISSMFSRFLENITFGLTSGWVTLTESRPDMIYSNSWPIFSTGLLSIIAYLRHIPLVLSIQDIYPESLFVQHRLKMDSWIGKILFKIDKFIALNASAIIVISKNFHEIYTLSRGIEAEKLHIIPNWSEDILGNQIIQVSSLRKKFNIPKSDFLIVFGGNIGKAAGLETVIEAMGLFPSDSIPYLLIAGEGSSLEECKSIAQRVGKNIVFFSPWPIEATASTYLGADLLILPTYSEQSIASVPSKLIGYMLSGRPVLALAVENSEVESIIQYSGCGWVIVPSRPDLLMLKIQEIMQLPPIELENRGNAGREYALNHFARQRNVPKVIEVLETASRSRSLRIITKDELGKIQ
jgi:colanic acid biosynthesis glycosyl transferase WcaI